MPVPAPGFGADYRGYLWVPEEAAYTFTISATDGACLWIDGWTAVSISGLPAGSTRSGTLSLEGGWHRLHCGLYSDQSAPSLTVWMRGGGQGFGEIDGHVLAHSVLMQLTP